MADTAGPRLDGSVALVTGGGRGIGRGISTELVAGGAAVAVTYVRDLTAAEDTVAELRQSGGRAIAVRCDVADPQQCDAAVEAAVAAYGQLDVLVSNGGIASRGATVEETSPDELERVLRVHAIGPYLLARAALPALRREPHSSVVFISSVGSQVYAPGGAPYAMGKAAVEALAHTLAREVRSQGIRVNVVAPGLVVTEMGRRLVRATRDVQDISELDAESPFGHVCTPQEIGKVVRYLVSAGAGYVNDQRIVVDGGTF